MVLIEVVELVVYINCLFAALFNMHDQLVAVAQRWVAFLGFLIIFNPFLWVADRASRETGLPCLGLSSCSMVFRKARLIISYHLFPDLPTGDEQHHSQAQQHHSEEGESQHGVHRSWLRPPRWQILLLEFTCLELFNLILDLLFFLRGCVH